MLDSLRREAFQRVTEGGDRDQPSSDMVSKTMARRKRVALLSTTNMSLMAVTIDFVGVWDTVGG